MTKMTSRFTRSLIRCSLSVRSFASIQRRLIPNWVTCSVRRKRALWWKLHEKAMTMTAMTQINPCIHSLTRSMAVVDFISNLHACAWALTPCADNTSLSVPRIYLMFRHGLEWSLQFWAWRVIFPFCTCPITPLYVHCCVKIIQLSWSFFGQSFLKWLIWQAVADYSSWQEPKRENSNRQEYFYTTL